MSSKRENEYETKIQKSIKSNELFLTFGIFVICVLCILSMFHLNNLNRSHIPIRFIYRELRSKFSS